MSEVILTYFDLKEKIFGLKKGNQLLGKLQT